MSLPYPLSRRRFVASAGAAAAGLASGPILLSPAGASAVPRPGAAEPLPPGLFTLGVASGDPTPDVVQRNLQSCDYLH